MFNKNKTPQQIAFDEITDAISAIKAKVDSTIQLGRLNQIERKNHALKIENLRAEIALNEQSIKNSLDLEKDLKAQVKNARNVIKKLEANRDEIDS